DDRHIAKEACLLLIVERRVERLQCRLQAVEARDRRVDGLLDGIKPRCRRSGSVSRTVGAEGLGSRFGGGSKLVERWTLTIIRIHSLRDGIERPALDVGALLAAAADQPVDDGGESAAAAARARLGGLRVASAAPIAGVGLVGISLVIAA